MSFVITRFHRDHSLSHQKATFSNDIMIGLISLLGRDLPSLADQEMRSWCNSFALASVIRYDDIQLFYGSYVSWLACSVVLWAVSSIHSMY